MEMPNFNLDQNNLDITSDAELQAAVEKEDRKGFEQGNYSLKITKPRFHENKDTKSIFCKKDSTWFNVAITLESADGRSKDYFIQVPTSKVRYGEKGKLFTFRKFCEFMASVGETVTLNNLGKICQKYFSSEDALKNLAGKEVTVDIAYTGAYAEKEGEQFKIMLPKSGAIQEDGETVYLPDVASARVYAEAKGLQLSYPEIVKLHSNVKVVDTKGWE